MPRMRRQPHVFTIPSAKQRRALELLKKIEL